jgi:hypothetical protein
LSAFTSRLLLSFGIYLITIGPYTSRSLTEQPQGFQSYVTTCGTDDDIPAKDHSAVDQAAMQFVQAVVSSNLTDAYAMFSSNTKKTVSLENLTAMNSAIQSQGPFRDLHATHTYLGKVTGGEQAQRVVCGDLSRPEDWVAVTIKPGPQQAHVIVEGLTINHTYGFVIWLMQEQESWYIDSFQFGPIAILGKTAQDLRAMAEGEGRRHHDFNACILYATALRFAARGPNVQLGIQPEIQKEMGQVAVPHELQGQSPFTWKFETGMFTVRSVVPIGISGKIYLLIVQELASWANDKDADRQNRELISAFAKAYPEYSDIFAGLAVEARERGGTRSYRTVDVDVNSAK